MRGHQDSDVEEGEARGRPLMRLHPLQAKFGALPAAVEERLQPRSLAELDPLAVALICAESLDELDL